MIRVLHVVNKMDRAGTETLIMNIYKNIDRERIQFDFAVHYSGGQYEDEIQRLGGKVYVMPPYRIYNGFSYAKYWKQFLAEHDGEWKIIHGHMRSSASIYLGLAKEKGIFTIAHSHSTDGKGLGGFLFHLLTYEIRKKADYFYGCSKDALISAFGMSPDDSNNCKVLNNGIECEKYVYDELTDKATRKELNLGNSFVVGHVGRFAYPKNHKFLIDIFEKILEKKPEAKLLLVGGGELESEIVNTINEKNLNDSIILTGIKEDVSRVLMCMDAFVFPSKYEGLGLSCVEAQATGVNCFISSGVPNEAFLTDNAKKIDLNKGPEYWSNIIINTQIAEKRENNNKIVKEKGYDIQQSVEELSKLYLGV